VKERERERKGTNKNIDSTPERGSVCVFWRERERGNERTRG